MNMKNFSYRNVLFFAIVMLFAIKADAQAPTKDGITKDTLATEQLKKMSVRRLINMKAENEISRCYILISYGDVIYSYQVTSEKIADEAQIQLSTAKPGANISVSLRSAVVNGKVVKYPDLFFTVVPWLKKEL